MKSRKDEQKEGASMEEALRQLKGEEGKERVRGQRKGARSRN